MFEEQRKERESKEMKQNLRGPWLLLDELFV